MVVGMEAELTVPGGRMGCGELAWLRGWSDQNPQWSRKQIARAVCRGWCWTGWRGLAEDRFKAAVKTLDFHHAREPLHAVAQSLPGPGTPSRRKGGGAGSIVGEIGRASCRERG